MKLRAFFLAALALFSVSLATPDLAFSDSAPVAASGVGASPTPVPSVDLSQVQIPVDQAVAVAAAKYAPPAWLASVLTTVEGLPYVGPVLLWVGKISALVAGIFTSLYLFLLALGGVLRGGAGWAGLDSVESVLGRVWAYLGPWLKFFSVLNQSGPLPGLASSPQASSDKKS